MSLSISCGSPSLRSSSTQDLSLDFQNCIKQGASDQVADLVAQGMSVNQVLPNGEMPLHFAVRLDQKDVALALLKLGADPEIKDFQHLSAIDHAALMKNEGLLATILGHKIGKDLKEVQEQMQCKGSASHVNALKGKIQKISTVDVAKLNPVSKAAYLGHLDEVAKLSAKTINELDAHGLAPVHYAVLGNRYEVVKQLIQMGADIRLLSKEGNSLLHFAAIAGSLQILNELISSGIDVNQKNSEGSTALHFASAKENLAFVEVLVKAGANPCLLDNRGMSALAMIGTSAVERDPLSLPKAHVVMFAATSLFWLSSLAVTTGWLTSNQDRQMAFLLQLGSVVAIGWGEFTVLLTNLNQKWKKAIAWVCFFGLAAIPPFSLGFQAWKTYHVARSAFEGLKNCWRNVGYRSMAAMRNAVVYGVNTAQSAQSLVENAKMTYELFLQSPYLFKMWDAYRREDDDAYFEACEEYLEFLNDRYNFNTKIVDVNECVDVKPSTLARLSTLDRLVKPELNPQCPEHALMMISPSYTMDQLRDQGEALYKKTYRQMMLSEVHPDKVGLAGDAYKDAAVRLNAASDTLKQWLARNKKT